MPIDGALGLIARKRELIIININREQHDAKSVQIFVLIFLADTHRKSALNLVIVMPFYLLCSAKLRETGILQPV